MSGLPIEALDFKLEEAYQSESAKAKLAAWAKRADERDWRPLWTWDEATRQAVPVMVASVRRKARSPSRTAEGNEILAWEPGREPTAAITDHHQGPAGAAAAAFSISPPNLKKCSLVFRIGFFRFAVKTEHCAGGG